MGRHIKVKGNVTVFLSAPVDGAGSTFLKHFYNDLVKKNHS